MRGLQAPTDVGTGDFLGQATVAAEEARQRLLSFMVHEIRNPLASALWSAEMLARQSLPDPRYERMAQLAARSVRRLRSLIEDVFALERLPVTAPPGHCDLRAAVEKALSPHDIEPEGIKAQIDGPTGIDVGIDPAVVDKLLNACLRRAVHAGSGGTISVKIEEREDGALLTILREGATPREVDPPLLTTGGSEGAGTTFALLVARVAAQRLGIGLWVEQVEGGTALRLLFPRRS